MVKSASELDVCGSGEGWPGAPPLGVPLVPGFMLKLEAELGGIVLEFMFRFEVLVEKYPMYEDWSVDPKNEKFISVPNMVFSQLQMIRFLRIKNG